MYSYQIVIIIDKIDPIAGIVKHPFLPKAIPKMWGSGAEVPKQRLEQEETEGTEERGDLENLRGNGCFWRIGDILDWAEKQKIP